MLQAFDTLPNDLLETDSRELGAVLGAPTLIHLDGAREPPLFVSVLMHGNETVGWDAIRSLLSERLERFGELRLPRALSLFIGNVTAAASGVRRLPGQPDYNRVWPGSPVAPTLEHDLMARVVAIMAERGVFASLDLHNNTGVNPHYACINVIDNRFLRLATLFSRTVVYFIRPAGVQSMAMARLCPAVTVECGKVGDQQGLEHARSFIDAALHLTEIPAEPLAPQDIDLYHTVAQVRVPEDVDFSFSVGDGELILDPELERMNFCELPPGTLFATCRGNDGIGLDVRDELGQDVGARFFSLDQGQLRLRQAVMPSMLTLDETVIRQDCLCYLMERYGRHVPQRAR
ncbi:peptidase M14 [Thiorhodococcus mannitoliphagus]|uniref:Peptidase M14 n=1 Tax=Thiorhodococcus mannitoliphagus TaxID=329406 RepID=A0A6P1DRK6_9GAMM|nr:M14 family metallopeptidase [Thiorhodococcus mannitoliphagus]NEX20887.1 peptidase M14 [Thiorhodococcus mannitoliphagus]